MYYKVIDTHCKVIGTYCKVIGTHYKASNIYYIYMTRISSSWIRMAS